MSDYLNIDLVRRKGDKAICICEDVRSYICTLRRFFPEFQTPEAEDVYDAVNDFEEISSDLNGFGVQNAIWQV